MSDPKSLAEGFIPDVLRTLLTELSVGLKRPEKCLARDLRTIEHRYSLEHTRFVTVSLPELGRSFDLSLASDAPFVFLGFKSHKGLPCFMGDLFARVFNADGLLLEDPSADAVRAIRQICYLFYKLDLPFDEEVVARKLNDFVEVDASLPQVLDSESLSPNTSCVIQRARYLLDRLFRDETFSHTGRRFNPWDISPRHGPGSVATGEGPHRKFRWGRFYRELDAKYPYTEYMYFNYSHLCDRLTHFENLKEFDFGKAKVALVPKDSRGPRLISMEPLEYQFLQQGLGSALVKWIENHPLTSGYVNFTDQNVNRVRAQRASINRVYDTLDMKDASDRVSLGLVSAVFPQPLLDCLLALRTRATRLPDGREVTLNKFAPMGSALCFPVESLLFWALATSILGPRKFRVQGRYRHLETYVYGDDLIVPHGALEIIKPIFEELHLQFNGAKCCTGKFFRESCGMDAFRGEDVSPIRVKHYGSSPTQLVALTAYANAFAAKNLQRTAELFFGRVEEETGPLTYAQPGQLSLSRHGADEVKNSLMNMQCELRINVDLQRIEFASLQPSPVKFHYGWSGWEELFRNHTENGKSAPRVRFQDGTYIELDATILDISEPFRQCEYTVPRAVRLTKTWTSLH